MASDPYDFWTAVLAGEEPELERDVVVAGRYWRRQRTGEVIGVAIDPLDDAGGFEVRFGKQPPFVIASRAQIEDFCEHHLSWFCRNAVSHEDYVAWWRTGEWPAGAIKEKPKAARGRNSKAVPAQPVAEPDAVSGGEYSPGQATAAPGILVRTYATLGCPEPREAYFARAIRFVGGRETTSVGFYGETAEGAKMKALAWVEAERAKPGRGRRAPSPEQSASAA